MKNFLDWRYKGKYAPRGECFDVGITVAGALAKYKENRTTPFTGCTHPMSAGNGGLMRLAPSLIIARNKEDALIFARESTRLTHGAEEALMYSEIFADEMWEGRVLLKYASFRHPLDIARKDVMSGGYVKETYQAAWWAYQTTNNFEDCIIEAINLVNIELGYEAFYAVILGNDQGRDLYKKKLIRLTEQYRMTNQIKFIDHCKDMALAYKVSDIVVSASIEPEAFGRVAVEAQSMEKPIIASNIGGSKETIVDEKTGFLFESNNAKSLSQKILKTLSLDEVSLKSIGIEGRKNIIQKFNVEKMCFSTYSEYKRILN